MTKTITPFSWRFALIPVLAFIMLNTATADTHVDLQVEAGMEAAQEVLREVIEEEGLIPGLPTHLSEMMARTGPALDKQNPVFSDAVVTSFCSARLSWLLTEEDPRQMTLCPFSIGLYVLPAHAGTVHITYRSPGNSSPARAKASDLLQKIVLTTQQRLANTSRTNQ